MAIKKFNAYEGISVGDGIITYDVIDNVGNVTANHLVVTNSANLGAVANVIITGGTLGYVLRTDGAGNLTWVNPAAAAVAGNNTEVQFNNSSSFGASANFTFDRTTNTLGITNIVSTNANVSGNTYLNNINAIGIVDFTTADNVFLGNLAEANYFKGNGSLLTNITGGNVTGQVGNALISGTVYTNAQPNITSVGTLTSLSITGNVTAGNASLGNLATANYFSGNGSLLTAITGANVTGTVANANYAAYVGNVINASQSNITSLGTLTTLSVTGNITSGNASLGNLVVANYFSGDGGLLANLNVANIGTVANANYAAYAGQVVDATQSNITSLGTLASLSVTGNVTAGNATLGNLAEANYLKGNGSLITGLTLANSLTDVVITSANNGQILGYNGVNWVNVNNSGSVSAGAGVNFYFTTPVINAIGPNSDIQVDTLSSTPNTSTQLYASVTVNGTGVINGIVSASLDRTIFDAGNWDFSIWANISSTAGTNTINCGVHQVLPNAGTVTVTGTGTSRTATASSGTPFATVVPGSDVILSSYLQLPNGLYRITAKTSDTVVTINVPSTYTNDTSALASVWIPLFNVDSLPLTSTAPTEYIFSTTQPAFNVTTDSAIGILVAANTSTSKTVSVTINGTNQGSHVLTPLHTLHDDLAGLQGGQSGEYFHLTTAEYTGTGNGIFVRQTSPQLTTPNIDAATGTSLTLTGNVTAGNASLGNLAVANYFSGNGSLLTHITGANVSGTVANANYAAYAGQVVDASQSNITSLGTLASLSVTGNISSGNANLGNLAVANFFSGDGSLLSNLQISNASVANANYATYAGTVVNASQSNITSLGTLSSLTSNGTINFTNASNVALGNVSNVHITGGQDGQILITDGAGNLQWVDNSPSTVTYLANSITLTHGVYVTGNLYSIQVFGDYADPDGVYVLTDGTGSAPAWWVDVDFVSVTNFNRVVMNINYTLASGHTIYVQLYNYTTSFSLSAGTVTTTSGTNIVTVSSTANMAVGQIIIFGTSVGGLTAGTPYYILSIPSSGQLTVGTVYNATTGTGTVTTLSTDSQTSTVDIENWDIIGSYTGLGAYYAFALQVVSDTNYLNAGQARLRLDHANQGNASHQTSIDYIALELSSQGPQGPRGPTGATGNTGPGVASGGTTGQVLVKNSNTNYDTAWTSTLSLTGNITVGNASLGNLVTANYFGGDGSLLTSLTGGNVTGQVGNALIAGTVYTNAQPNITSVGTLSSLSVTGNISSGNANLGNLVVANYFSGDGGLLANLNVANIGTVANANYAAYAGQVVDATQSNITSLGTLASLSVSGNISSGNANLGNLATASYFSGDGSLLTSITGGNVTGQVGNALIAGTVYTNAQPNITSVGTLSTLNVTGNITSGANLIGKLFSSTNTTLAVPGPGNVSGERVRLYNFGNPSTTNFAIGVEDHYIWNAVDATNSGFKWYAGNVLAATLEGTGQFTTVGNITAANANLGNLVVANYFSGDGSLLSNLQIANASVANANYAAYAGQIIDATQSNITSLGTLSSLSVTGNISSGNANLGNLAIANYFSGNGSLLTSITGGNVTGQVGNALVAGTVYTNAQPNITSVGTLSSLSVTGNITANNMNVTNDIHALNIFAGNLLAANYFQGDGSALSNVTSSTGNASYALTAGYVEGNSQPNITAVGTLVSLVVSGNLTSGNASLGNLATASYFSGDGSLLTNVTAANITGTVANANYAAYTGNVVNATQSNITSLGTLSGLSVSGNATITGNLTVSGTTIYANVTTLNVKDPIIEMGGNPNGDPLTTNDGKDRGTLLHYYNGGAIDAFMGWDSSNAEFGFGSNVSTTNEVVTWNNYGNIRASYFLGNASQLTGIIANANYAHYTDHVVLGAQPNITSVGTLISLTVTGNVTAGNATLGNLVVANYFSGDGSLLANLNVANIGTVANSNYAAYAGNVVNASQSNITSLGTLTSLSVTGNISSGNANLGNLAVANFFSGDGSLLSNLQISNASVANANYASYAGTVVNASQSNITSLGTLSSLSVTGNISSGNANLGNLAIANYFSGDGSLLSNLNVANIGTVANANYAAYSGNVVNASQSNITSLGTLSGLTSTGVINFVSTSNVSLGAVSNIHITGGSDKNVLQTNGSGTLSWGALSAAVDTFTGDGSETDFSLSVTPASKNLTMVNYNGAIMLKADYSLTANTITISSPPATGSKIEVTTFYID